VLLRIRKAVLDIVREDAVCRRLNDGAEHWSAGGTNLQIGDGRS
jgi:hypothetical protein